MIEGVRDAFRALQVRIDGWLRNGSLTLFFLARRRAPAVLLFTVVALAGCSAVTRPAPVRQTFLLESPAPQAVANPRPGTLRVGVISVAAPFRGKAFVYRMDDLRYETDFYVEFLVPPTAMLSALTSRALGAAKPFARVAGPGEGSDADWVLTGFASELYADGRDAGKPAAVMDITFYLTAAEESAQTPVWTHEYRQRVPMRDRSEDAYAEALNKAFAAMVGDLARDLASADLPKR